MRQAVLLDLYDTIASARWADLEAQLANRMGLAVVAVRHGYRANAAALLTGGFASASEEMAAVAASALGSPPNAALVEELVGIESSFFATQVRLFTDAEPTMRQLRARGAAIAVISNCSSNTEPLVERLGLYELADVVVLSSQLGSAKPDRHIYRHALEMLGVAAPASLFVDDQVPYLDGAKELRIATAQMVHAESLNQPPRTGTHPVVTGVSALLDLL